MGALGSAPVSPEGLIRVLIAGAIRPHTRRAASPRLRHAGRGAWLCLGDRRLRRPPCLPTRPRARRRRRPRRRPRRRRRHR
ncbi:hypothetical protein DCC79_02050 [bacterium]|nr:hypothetical protein [Chloroflexi bacterium CFX6]RIL12267.1 MAG: hypothetical protein DCC79_02050 [bacterium]